MKHTDIWNIWSQWLSPELRDLPSVQTGKCLSLVFAGAGL